MVRLKRKTPPARRRLRPQVSAAPIAPAFSSSQARRKPGGESRQLSGAEKPSRRRQKQDPIPLVALGVALLVAVYLIVLSPGAQLQIEGSVPNGAMQRYQSAADSLLAASIWNRNKLTLNDTALSRQLQKQFPELQSVAVSVPFFGHHAIVHLAPAQPALLFAAASGTYVLDTRGVALGLQPNLPSTATRQLPLLTDESNLSVSTGKQVLPSSQINFIKVVLKQLQAKGVGFSKLVLPEAASELDVYISGQPYFVKFNLAEDTARAQAGTFLATRQMLAGQHITPSKYIDVRLEGRAYYQ